jgi:hypothetical protein
VLEHLLRRSNRVITKSLLETSLSGLSQEIGSNAVEVYVQRLRKHLTENGASVLPSLSAVSSASSGSGGSGWQGSERTRLCRPVPPASYGDRRPSGAV